jgi:hypothetical protein
VRHPTVTHVGFPFSHQRPRGANESITQGRHNVPSAGALDPAHIVLLGMRTAFKKDLQTSVIELVYGEPLLIRGELLAASTTTGNSSVLITHLRCHFKQLRTVPASLQASRLSSSATIWKTLPMSSSGRVQYDARCTHPTAAPTRC